MLKSSSCEYSHTYIAVKGTITVPNTRTATAPSNKNKEVVFKNCAPFTDCIREINNLQIDQAKDIDAVMKTNNLIESSENYSKRPRSLWLYYRKQPALDDNDNVFDFPLNDDTSISFKYRKM